jgi:hypothetical protein
MNKTLARLALLAFIAPSALLADPVYAQSNDVAPVPGHPRVNEVNQRLDNQQRRIDAGVANGTITPTQAARDERRNEAIAQRASVDEARHNGHLTAGETRRLNRAENRTSHRIYRQKH